MDTYSELGEVGPARGRIENFWKKTFGVILDLL